MDLNPENQLITFEYGMSTIYRKITNDDLTPKDHVMLENNKLLDQWKQEMFHSQIIKSEDTQLTCAQFFELLDIYKLMLDVRKFIKHSKSVPINEDSYYLHWVDIFYQHSIEELLQTYGLSILSKIWYDLIFGMKITNIHKIYKMVVADHDYLTVVTNYRTFLKSPHYNDIPFFGTKEKYMEIEAKLSAILGTEIFPE
jgi:hypothetical protein